VISLTPSFGPLFSPKPISPQPLLFQHRQFPPPPPPRLSPLVDGHRIIALSALVSLPFVASSTLEKRLAAHRTASLHHPQLASSGRRKATFHPNIWDRPQTSRRTGKLLVPAFVNLQPNNLLFSFDRHRFPLGKVIESALHRLFTLAHCVVSVVEKCATVF